MLACGAPLLRCRVCVQVSQSLAHSTWPQLLSAGHAIRNMLCPHVFRNLASISELNFEPPPAHLLSAFPALVCELAPPVKFGWQVSPPAARMCAPVHRRILQPPPALKKENEFVQVCCLVVMLCFVLLIVALLKSIFISSLMFLDLELSLSPLISFDAGIACTNSATS